MIMILIKIIIMIIIIIICVLSLLHMQWVGFTHAQRRHA